MKRLFDNREKLFTTSLSESILIMLFFILSMAFIGLRQLEEAKKELKEYENSEQIITDLMNEKEKLNAELNKYKFAEGPVVCGQQKDQDGNYIGLVPNDEQLAFSINFEKINKSTYRLRFTPNPEYKSNSQLLEKTPGLWNKGDKNGIRIFTINKNKQGLRLFTNEELTIFLKSILNSRRINESDKNCEESNWASKGYCLECRYHTQLIKTKKDVTKEDFRDVITFLESYFTVAK